MLQFQLNFLLFYVALWRLDQNYNKRVARSESQLSWAGACPETTGTVVAISECENYHISSKRVACLF